MPADPFVGVWSLVFFAQGRSCRLRSIWAACLAQFPSSLFSLPSVQLEGKALSKAAISPWAGKWECESKSQIYYLSAGIVGKVVLAAHEKQNWCPTQKPCNWLTYVNWLLVDQNCRLLSTLSLLVCDFSCNNTKMKLKPYLCALLSSLVCFLTPCLSFSQAWLLYFFSKCVFSGRKSTEVVLQNMC